MQGPGEAECEQEETVVERKDAQGTAGVKGLEEVGYVQGVKEDACDEEAGESEEEIDADVCGGEDALDDVEEPGAGDVVGLKEMDDEDEKDGSAADAIECRDVNEAARIGGVGFCLLGWGFRAEGHDLDYASAG